MIKFKQISEKEIEILFNDKKVGYIFTPGGSGKDTLNGIQICGFDHAFDLWGCGIFKDYNGNSKKDIQLLFSEDSLKRENFDDISLDCVTCYNKPCTCKDLTVKSNRDLKLIYNNVYKIIENEIKIIEKKLVKDRTSCEHQYLIKHKYDRSVYDYLRSMGDFKDGDDENE